jgi:hypothetical protein
MDALARLAPTTDDYARLPVAQALTWGDCAAEIAAGEWYLVVFRSIMRADADKDRLQAYDDFAHAEAEHAEGFLHYFKGPLAADRSCLSFCLWNSRAEARAAAGRPAHREAVAIIGETYEQYLLEFMRVRKRDRAASLEFEPYDLQPEVAPGGMAPRTSLGFSPAAS